MGSGHRAAANPSGTLAQPTGPTAQSMDRLGLPTTASLDGPQPNSTNHLETSIMPGFFSHLHNPFAPPPAPEPEPAKATRKRTPRTRKTTTGEGQGNATK